MAQEFPPYPKLTFVVDPLFPKSGTRDFVGSIQKEVIEKIKGLKCTKCGTILINEKAPPKTGYCGHLFCTDCAKKLYVNVPIVKVTGVPRSIVFEKFEIDCEQIMEFSLYDCKICKSVKHDELERNKFVRLFSDNIMLRDLFKALKCYNGFRCEDCKGGCTFHPKFNSLHCVTCSKGKVNKQYVCVWDIDKHRGHKLEIMEENDEVHKEHHSPGLELSSLDRKTRKVFAALYHCACCSTSLENDYLMNTKHRHLECGHLIGARCVENAREKMVKRMNGCLEAYSDRTKTGEAYDPTDPLKDEGCDVNDGRDGIFCNFCEKDPVSKSDLKLYPVFPPFKFELYDIIIGKSNMLAECTFDCEKCDFTPCNTLFSDENIDQKNGRCQWCKVQHLLNRRDCKDSD